ncbi:MAG: hypothetical protein Q7T80_14510 [Methanoregula sp.]|nr:hypothetical protein [Methanoregula sp.]
MEQIKTVIPPHLIHQKRYLIGQLGAFGDCLYATTVACQIKTDFPDCHLTWAIGSRYRSILDGNPYIDAIWELPLSAGEDMVPCWEQFEKEALERKNSGDFDEIFFTQIYPNNFKNFDGTVRSSIFRGYNRPITVPVAPVLFLSEAEIENVRSFADSYTLRDKKQVILFECSPKSNQSFVTLTFAQDVSKKIIKKNPDCCIILSSNESFHPDNRNIIDGSKLSFRENAELSKYCTLLIGCSSGVSWLCTSAWAKPLPMVQLLKKATGSYASFVHDYNYHGLDTRMIIEMTDCPAEKVSACIQNIFSEGFEVARKKYHQQVRVHLFFYLSIIGWNVIRKGKFQETIQSLNHFINRWFFR